MKALAPVAAASLLSLAVGCGAPAPPAGDAITVGVEPPSARLRTGASARFGASVTRATDTSVIWDVVETGGGAIDDTGLYTAPGAPGVFHVRATSRAAPSVSGRATVTVVPPVAVTVTPSPAATDACATLAFTPSVTGASDGSVTWSVQEGETGGFVTAAGVYTAPADPGTYHVVATSRADPTRSAVVPVTVSERVLSVVVTPADLQVAEAGTARFVATVTTTCGAFVSTRTVAAPRVVAPD